MQYVLETHNLGKNYKSFKALSNLNMHVPKNAIYGLIGKNGVGKTTLIRVICGLQLPTQGAYSIYGIKNTDKNISQIGKRIGAIIESPAINENMSAKENLIMQFKMLGNTSFDEIDELLNLVGLGNVGDKKVSNFSLGMKQRLGIATAISANPDFLILDEPINGLDPEGIIEMRELLLKLNKYKKITILISSHYLDELSKIATHYGFMDKGTIIKEISKDNLNKELENKIELKVDDVKKFIEYLEDKKYEYKVIDDTHINIYGKLNIANLIQDLSKRNLKVLEIHENNETLESYYMNLVGVSNE